MILTGGNTMKKIYLDQASTSFPKASSVADAVYQYLSGSPVNVGRGGYQAAYDVEETILKPGNSFADYFIFHQEKEKI